MTTVLSKSHKNSYDSYIAAKRRSINNRLRQDEYTTLPNSFYENTIPGTMDKSIVMLDEALYSNNPEISKQASEQLAKIGFISVKALTTALRCDIKHVAINAANGIRMIGSIAKTAIFDLTWMLHNRDKECRETAAATLGILKSIPSVSVHALSRALTDEELTVRQYASAALGEFDGEQLVQANADLQVAANDVDETVQTFSKYALSKINDLQVTGKLQKNMLFI